MRAVGRHRHPTVESVDGRCVLEVAGRGVLEAQEGGAQNLDASISHAHYGSLVRHAIRHIHVRRQVDRSRIGSRWSRVPRESHKQYDGEHDGHRKRNQEKADPRASSTGTVHGRGTHRRHVTFTEVWSGVWVGGCRPCGCHRRDSEPDLT